jgi:isopenicillin N synthase-like dioxygenase
VNAAPVCDLALGPDELLDALARRGCAALVGHGVDRAVIHDMRVASLAFFDLPRAEKARVEFTGNGLWRGWQPVLEGGARYGGDAGPTELLERLEENLCPAAGGPDATENRWPGRPAGLRDAWQAYHDAMFQLTARLVAMLVDALGIEPGPLPAWCDEQFSNLVANHYPAQLVPPQPGQVRVAPHTDHGGLTVLQCDDAPGGLEVAFDERGWQPASLPSGALLVQVGDLLERWSSGHLRATPHRVVNPPAGSGAAGRRLSLVYFHHPRLDLVVASGLPGGEQYEPVTAGAWVQARQDAYRRGEPSLP